MANVTIACGRQTAQHWCLVQLLLPYSHIESHVLCAHRESLQQIEARLLAAEEAARHAKDAVQGQADIAKLERERALAARGEAEQANKNLDSARYQA